MHGAAPSDQTGQCRIIVHNVKPERTADDIGEIGQDHQRACLNFKDVVMPPTVANRVPKFVYHVRDPENASPPARMAPGSGREPVQCLAPEGWLESGKFWDRVPSCGLAVHLGVAQVRRLHGHVRPRA